MLAKARWFRLCSVVMAAVFGLTAGTGQVWAESPSSPSSGRERWYKGNTHTHTWFSDGTSPAEMVVAWYKEHGYQFLALSDHNSLDNTPKWKPVDAKMIKGVAPYEKEFGAGRVRKRQMNNMTEYGLVPLSELRKQYEEPGRFIVVPGEEISTAGESRPVHVNAFNIKEVVPPEKGATVPEAIRKSLAAVSEQRKKAGQPMLAHVSHPNFGWALTAEDIAGVEEARLFEVYNGHGGVRNYGDELHASTERMWDIILTTRLEKMGGPMLYGVASDDAHAYPWAGGGMSPPGRGWIMVRAKALAPSEIVLAMERGDFYATTGVVLNGVRFANDTLEIEIAPRAGVSYTTQFIGTVAGYDRTVTPQKDKKGVRVTSKYSDDVGKVLAEQTGLRASYKLTGQEIYVRAKIISSAKHPNPHAAGDFEVAWVQPVQPSSRRTAS